MNDAPEWVEVPIDTSMTYDAPAEFLDIDNLRALLRATENRLGGFRIVLHPMESTCAESACRANSAWQSDLLGEQGVRAAYPFALAGEDLRRYAETVLWNLLGTRTITASSEYESPTLHFYACANLDKGFCREAVLLDVRDTANGILKPLAAIARAVAPVAQPPETQGSSPAKPVISTDRLSVEQLSAVGVSADSLASLRFVPDSTYADGVPFIISRCDLGNGADIIVPGFLPARVTAPVSIGVFAPPFGPPKDFGSTDSDTHFVDAMITEDVGSDIVSGKVVYLHRTESLACGHEVVYSLIALLDDWSSLGRSESRLPEHGFLRVNATVYSYSSLPFFTDENRPQVHGAISQMLVTGRVDSAALLVNRQTRKTYWVILLAVPIVCLDAMHALENSELAFTREAFITAICPDDGREPIVGETISTLGACVCDIGDFAEDSTIPLRMMEPAVGLRFADYSDPEGDPDDLDAPLLNADPQIPDSGAIVDAVAHLVGITLTLGQFDELIAEAWVFPEGVKIKISGTRDGETQEIGDRELTAKMFETLERIHEAHANAGQPWTYLRLTVNTNNMDFRLHVSHDDITP